MLSHQQHDALSGLAKSEFDATSPLLRNGVSCHVIKPPVTLASLDAFVRLVRSQVGVNLGVFLGSIDGTLRVSIKSLDERDATKNRKRGREQDWLPLRRLTTSPVPFSTTVQRAAEAVDRIRAQTTQTHASDEKTYEATLVSAQNALVRIMDEFRGPVNEDVVENVGLVSTEAAGQSNTGIIVAVRTASGVPLSLSTVQSVGADYLLDGCITNQPQGLGATWKVTPSTRSRGLENEGQQSIYCFATVRSVEKSV
jgi:hypothetical protein